LAEVRLASGPEQINHRERQRAITIQVKPPPEMALEDAMQRIQNGIVAPLEQSGQLEGGYRITLAGTADKLKLMQRTFIGQWTGWNMDSFISILTSQFALVLIITYLMMAALFESPLDVLTMLGFLILIGTVVNNPILIVHQALNHIREDGMSPREAVLESTRTRIRPIFMTTLTNFMGLLPLVLFPGAGSELYRGLGSVTLGGLLVSTVFTLVLVPTLFTLAMEGREAIMHKLTRQRRQAGEGQPAEERRRAAEEVAEPAAV
jgi:HAE1 family hydrophobic/amphiphilic exporter-1